MPDYVVLLVLLGALLHAIWNIAVKSGESKLFNSVLVATGAGIIAIFALPFFSPPNIASWPYIAASVVLQVIYFPLVAAAYKAGDISQTYPLMRGLAPLLVILFGGFFIAEVIPIAGWIGVALICLGVLSLSFERRKKISSIRGIVLSIIIAFIIATSTIIDGIGVRLSGSPIAYVLWIFFLGAIVLFLFFVFYFKHSFLQYAKSQIKLTAIGGTGTLGSYGLALWAMTIAPIAIVAALRETSIVFATLLAMMFLHEHISKQRWVSICLILLGVITTRLS